MLPFLERARAAYPDLALSLDTWRSEVARAAAPAGVDLVNDTWAGHDPELVGVAAELGAGVVVSHTGGLPPRTDPVDVTTDPTRSTWCATSSRPWRVVPRQPSRPECRRSGSSSTPTLDFGKTTAHSLQVLRHTSDVVALGFPVLQALSRKDFVGESLDLPADERLEGSLAATAVAALAGRHGLPRARRARDPPDADMVATIRGDRTPELAVRGVPRERPEKYALRRPPHAHRLC